MSVGSSPALPIWVTFAFGGATLVALYLCLAANQKWRPFAQPPTGVGDPSGDGHDSAKRLA
jgi:hypothetical protein